MAKKYYETLEVSETATQDEIKKSYRKLALKWHPDKWMNKSSEEKETAHKKIQELNKAYEILGDEEMKRRYDNGEEFTSDFGGYDYEAEIKEEARRKEEELRKAKIERMDLELEIIKLEMKSLDRSSTINEIGMAFNLTYPLVFKENLDPRLWEGYQDWGEKVVKMEITIPKGKDRSEELKEFKEKMIKSIKEAETILEAKEKEKQSKKKERAGSKVGREKTSAIEEIERLMTEKKLKTQDLGEYSNYQDQIDNLNKVWEIRELRDKIMEAISNWRGKTRTSREDRKDKDNNLPMPPEPRKDTSNQSPDNPNDNNKKDKVDYKKLSREELIKVVKQKDLEIGDLKEIIWALENRVSELEEEIRELKAEPQTAEIQQEIRKRESQLQEFRNGLEKINSNDNSDTQNSGKNNPSNKFPVGWVVGGGILVIIGLVTTLFIIGRSKKKRKKKLSQ